MNGRQGTAFFCGGPESPVSSKERMFLELPSKRYCDRINRQHHRDAFSVSQEYYNKPPADQINYSTSPALSFSSSACQVYGKALAGHVVGDPKYLPIDAQIVVTDSDDNL